jgi:hypothetical protein
MIKKHYDQVLFLLFVDILILEPLDSCKCVCYLAGIIYY